MKSQVSFSEIYNKPTLTNGSRAVVIGGSIAGLVSARVLSAHFGQVTIIERDNFPAGPEPRASTPQARHVHALLARGLRILEAYLPGLRNELLAEGAVEVEIGSDVAWLNPQGWGVKFDSGIKAISFSRGLLDWVVRRRLAAIPNIRFVEGSQVSELIANDAGDRLTGVSFHRRIDDNVPEGEEEWLAADLVVDASGRASKTPQWLSALGYDRPKETVINAHLGYASRIYQIPSDFQADWKATFVQAAPPEHRRGGILFPIEGNRWLVTMIGGERDYPPTDEEGFLQFARSLRSHVIYDTIKNAQPLTPLVAHRGTENRRRHYDELRRWPENLIVIGDGACAFNPVYGQGMTTAAMGAECLDICLREVGGKYLTRLGRRFQKGLARLNADPWMLATGEDYRYRQAEGGTPNLFNRFMHRYIDQILQLTTHHTGVRKHFLEVQGMLKSPTTLFAPGIALKVAVNALRNFFRAAKTTGIAMSEAPVKGIRGKASPSRF